MHPILTRRYVILASLLIKNRLLLLCDYANIRAMRMHYACLNGHPIPTRYPPWTIR